MDINDKPKRKRNTMKNFFGGASNFKTLAPSEGPRKKGKRRYQTITGILPPPEVDGQKQSGGSNTASAPTVGTSLQAIGSARSTATPSSSHHLDEAVKNGDSPSVPPLQILQILTDPNDNVRYEAKKADLAEQWESVVNKLATTYNDVFVGEGPQMTATSIIRTVGVCDCTESEKATNTYTVMCVFLCSKPAQLHMTNIPYLTDIALYRVSGAKFSLLQ